MTLTPESQKKNTLRKLEVNHFPSLKAFPPEKRKHMKHIMKEMIKATQTLWIWRKSWNLITPTFISAGQLLLSCIGKAILNKCRCVFGTSGELAGVFAITT